jgi:putative endonuclease
MDTLNWTVYVLKCADNRSYVGCTENINERLQRHSSGGVPATKERLPIELIHTITFQDKYKAFEFEKYLKSGSGRAFMKKHLL